MSDVTWQAVFSHTDVENAGRGSFGGAYDFILDGLTLRSVFLTT